MTKHWDPKWADNSERVPCGHCMSLIRYFNWNPENFNNKEERIKWADDRRPIEKRRPLKRVTEDPMGSEDVKRPRVSSPKAGPSQEEASEELSPVIEEEEEKEQEEEEEEEEEEGEENITWSAVRPQRQQAEVWIAPHQRNRPRIRHRAWNFLPNLFPSDNSVIRRRIVEQDDRSARNESEYMDIPAVPVVRLPRPTPIVRLPGQRRQPIQPLVVQQPEEQQQAERGDEEEAVSGQSGEGGGRGRGTGDRGRGQSTGRGRGRGGGGSGAGRQGQRRGGWGRGGR